MAGLKYSIVVDTLATFGLSIWEKPREVLEMVANAGETTNLEAYILNDTLRDCAYRVSWQITTDKGPLAEGKGDFEIPGGEMEAFSLLLSVSKVSTVGSVRETAFRYRTPMVKRQLERDPAMAGVDYRVKERVIRRPA